MNVSRKPTSTRIKNWLLLRIALLSLVCFCMLAMVASQPGTAALETSWLWHIHQLHTPLLSRIAVALAWLGGLPALAVMGLTITGLMLKQHRTDLAQFSVISLCGAVILSWGCKWTFARARPDVWAELVGHYGSSFPSGHSIYAVTLAGVLIITGRQSRYYPWLLPTAVVWGLAMGFSRVYLGAHFLTDVLAGWALAIAWLCGLLWFFKQFNFLNKNSANRW